MERGGDSSPPPPKRPASLLLLGGHHAGDLHRALGAGVVVGEDLLLGAAPLGHQDVDQGRLDVRVLAAASEAALPAGEVKDCIRSASVLNLSYTFSGIIGVFAFVSDRKD